MDARGIDDIDLVEGCQRSTMEELSDWTQEADNVLSC
jgi:sulfur relay (sulfurtransferase) complex TusBCD TusD component (DsrE family)